jgi:hypothetical protein
MLIVLYWYMIASLSSCHNKNAELQSFATVDRLLFSSSVALSCLVDVLTTTEFQNEIYLPNPSACFSLLSRLQRASNVLQRYEILRY